MIRIKKLNYSASRPGPLRTAFTPFVIYDDGPRVGSVDTYDDLPLSMAFRDAAETAIPPPTGLLTYNHTSGMEYALIASIISQHAA